jgi:rare lipoprotein A
VVELSTGRSVVVRINDRGPFIEGRIIDLSKGAAEKLGIVEKGITKVGCVSCAGLKGH